jgi:hypothetical protein
LRIEFPLRRRADISLADISLADISLADISLADISLADVSLAHLLAHALPHQSLAHENEGTVTQTDGAYRDARSSSPGTNLIRLTP